MKGRHNARTHRGNYGKSDSAQAQAKHKRPANYAALYARFPNLAKRPAMSSLAVPPTEEIEA